MDRSPSDAASPRGTAPPCGPPVRVRWTLAVAGVAAVLFTWPLALHPFEVIGHPLAEADNHLWMFWRAITLLGAEGTERALADYPNGIPIPLMDPINLPLALPGFLLHPALGYNGMLLANVLLGLGGGWWLSRQFAGPRAAWIGMVAIGGAPFLAGVVEFGITESWPLWALSAHLAFLWRHARSGGWRDALGAGLCLGAFALSGWYNAFFALIVELLLLPWLALAHRRWKGLLLQAILGGAVVLPTFLHFLTIRSYWVGRWHFPAGLPAGEMPHWRWKHIFGSDLLNFFLPDLQYAPVSRSVYLGVGVLVLAVVGCWSRRREALPFVLAALVFVVLALGHWLRVGGRLVEMDGVAVAAPARLLAWWFPPLTGLSRWHRAAGPAVVFVGVLAAMGADCLVGRSTPRALALVAILLLDFLLLGQTRWPRVHFPLDLPPIYEQLDAPGAVIDLPFDNGRPILSDRPARSYNRWQILHGRPVAENYEGMDTLLATNRLVAVADLYCGVISTRPHNERPPASMSDPVALEKPGVMEAAVEHLVSSGFAYVVLHRTRARTPDRAHTLLKEALGEPEIAGDRWTAWRVDGR